MNSPTLAAFLIASLVLAVTPGPAVVYIVTRTMAQGRSAGLASVLGIALGNLGNVAAAAIGLAALFAASAAAFVVVKLAGAAYLVVLGIATLRARPDAAAVSRVEARPGRLFRDGLVVALFNPKTALFFAALLPQFVDPHASALGQSIALGCSFVAIALCTDTLYVLTASAFGAVISRWAQSRPYGRYLTAASFVSLGVYAALANPRGIE